MKEYYKTKVEFKAFDLLIPKGTVVRHKYTSSDGELHWFEFQGSFGGLTKFISLSDLEEYEVGE